MTGSAGGPLGCPSRRPAPHFIIPGAGRTSSSLLLCLRASSSHRLFSSPRIDSSSLPSPRAPPLPASPRLLFSLGSNKLKIDGSSESVVLRGVRVRVAFPRGRLEPGPLSARPREGKKRSPLPRPQIFGPGPRVAGSRCGVSLRRQSRVDGGCTVLVNTGPHEGGVGDVGGTRF